MLDCPTKEKEHKPPERQGGFGSAYIKSKYYQGALTLPLMKGDTSLPTAAQNRIPANENLLKAIAMDQCFQLYRHYSEAQAAKIIGIHPATLKKLRLKGKLPFVRLGQRRVAYFGYQIATYLITQIQPCHATQNEDSNLETSGLASEAGHRPTTALGSTNKIDGPTALHSALRTMTKPKSA